jgi:nucleoside-diphosphate-sugar epimerase
MSRVCVLGAGGFVGRNLIRDTDWVGVTRQDLDLTNQLEVEEYFKTHEYDAVIHCAVVGGSRLKPDDAEVLYKNLLMFENVARVFNGKLIYFSSGAALRGDPPTDPYGLSKWLIDRRIDAIPNAYSLRIWGCYGPGELPTRFSAVCKRQGHVVIERDRYFDFIDIEDVKDIVRQYLFSKRMMPKCCDLVYPEKKLLSQWAKVFGASWEIKDISELGESYIKGR